jgi:hypothetical protein
MDGSMSLLACAPKSLLQVVKNRKTHEKRLREHSLLLLADGWVWTTMAAVLFTRSSTINRWRNRFDTGALMTR